MILTTECFDWHQEENAGGGSMGGMPGMM
jgi:hypothetical protein